MNQDKIYNNMENILQDINGKCIRLNEEEKKRNNGILLMILNLIEDGLKATDSLFKAMYRKIYYGGSYYDGLKVNKPNQYDMDLVMVLPKIAKPKIIPHDNKSSFVELHLLDLPAFYREPTSLQKYKDLDKLLNGKKLDSQKCVYWMQSILTRVLADYWDNAHSCYILKTYQYGDFKVRMSKRGGSPAFKLIIKSTEDYYNNPNVEISINLVPCFVLSSENWPDGFRINETDKSEFCVVPKYQVGCNFPCWRLSFQEQERVLIESKQNLKPALRLLKKIRDVQKQVPMTSYFLKTAVLLEINNFPHSFWSKSLSLVFMTLLKKYRDRLYNNNLPYYWKDDFNLIGHFKSDHISNLYNRTQRIINDLEAHLNNPDMLRKKLYEYLLTPDEQLSMSSSSDEQLAMSSFVPPSRITAVSYDTDDEDYGAGTSTSTASSSGLSALGWGLTALAIVGGVTAGAVVADRYINNNRRRNN